MKRIHGITMLMLGLLALTPQDTLAQTIARPADRKAHFDAEKKPFIDKLGGILSTDLRYKGGHRKIQTPVNPTPLFGKGFLAEMYNMTMRDPSFGLIHGFQGDHNVGSWDLFLLRDHVVADYGLFDENLYPAYNEDSDYFLRFVHKPIRKVMNLNSDYYHGDGKKNEYHTHGRQISKSDPILKQKLEEVNLMNIDYLTHKWGRAWRWCSPTELPFNDKPIGYTTYDLRFVRQKHLGF